MPSLSGGGWEDLVHQTGMVRVRYQPTGAPGDEEKHPARFNGVIMDGEQVLEPMGGLDYGEEAELVKMGIRYGLLPHQGGGNHDMKPLWVRGMYELSKSSQSRTVQDDEKLMRRTPVEEWQILDEDEDPDDSVWDPGFVEFQRMVDNNNPSTIWHSQQHMMIGRHLTWRVFDDPDAGAQESSNTLAQQDHEWIDYEERYGSGPIFGANHDLYLHDRVNMLAPWSSSGYEDAVWRFQFVMDLDLYWRPR